MAKEKIDMFADLFGREPVPAETVKEKKTEKKEEIKTVPEDVFVQPDQIEFKESEKVKKAAAKDAPKDKYVQKAFYITKDQYLKIKERTLQAAADENSRDKDLSAVVRNALDRYLK